MYRPTEPWGDNRKRINQITQRQWMKDLREHSPRVHCITNYVTAGDVIDMILTAGGSPVMAQGLHRVESVTSICSNLILNLGVPEEKTVPAMEVTGRKATVLSLPVILDPVRTTASRFRRRTAIDITRKIVPFVIRGNEAEIRALNQELREREAGNTCGMSSGTFGTIENRLKAAYSLRNLTGAVAIMTGEKDVVTGEERRLIVRNGHPWMARTTGSGCMLGGLMGAFYGLYGELEPDDLLEEAVIMALSAHGLCGGSAAGKTAGEGGGTGTSRMYLMDEMSLLDSEALGRGKKVEIR